MQLRIGEDVAGGALVIVPEMGDGILQLGGIGCVEVVYT